MKLWQPGCPYRVYLHRICAAFTTLEGFPYSPFVLLHQHYHILCSQHFVTQFSKVRGIGVMQRPLLDGYGTEMPIPLC